MLERFTHDARAVVVAARAEAVRRGDNWIGTEHLLVGLLEAGGTEVAELADLELSLDDIRARIAAHVPAGSGDDLDAGALATLGIDLAAVQLAAESQFGRGALAPLRRGRGRTRLTRRAKKVLEYSLREAQQARYSSISSAHVLLGLLREGKGLGAQVMAEAGVDLDDVHSAVGRRLRDERAA